MTIVDYIFKHAAETPNKLAIADKKKQLTYVQLSNKITSIANYLMIHNVKAGDIVGLRAQQTVEFAACLFGIHYLGAVVCPIEKVASRDRTNEILQQISAKFLLDVNDFAFDNVTILKMYEAYNCTYIENKINRTYLMNDISDIIFTTGTTGKSKGIQVSNKANVAIAQNVIDSVEMIQNEVELITSPLSHSLALRRMYAAMYIGSSVIFSENFLLYENFFGMIEKYNVTAITLVPAILTFILEIYKDKLGEFDNQLHYIQLGSATLYEGIKQKLVKLLPTTRLYNTYGATEAGCTIILEFSKFGDKKGCIGRTTVNTELFFTDKSRCKKIEAIDEKNAGYMAFVGDMNMSGYINDPIQTTEVLQDGIIYTNDIGYRGKDGFIYLLGRAGEVINCGGLKVNPMEIEEVVMKISGIKDCACVPMEDERLGEVPKLFIVYENGLKEKISDKELKQYISRYLEDYKVPKKIEEINAVPRTFNGKIIRKELL